MAKGNNIVHQYFKKEMDGAQILVKVNPIEFKGIEISRSKDGETEMRELEFDSEIFNDLKADGFEPSGPLEFNLYFAGLA